MVRLEGRVLREEPGLRICAPHVAVDPVALPKPAGLLTGLDDRAGSLRAEYPGKPGLNPEALGHHPPEFADVPDPDPCGFDPDQHLARLWLRHGNIPHREDFRAAEAVYRDGAHVLSLEAGRSFGFRD